MFDIEDTGYIKKTEIKQAFNKLGREISDDQIDEMFTEFDKDNDGIITREEWREVVD